MADLAFAPQHNMIAYLEKTENDDEFHQIVDFLTSSSIHHSLTVSPTIYASNIEQFWNTSTSQTINDEKQFHAIVYGKTVVIIESSVRRDLLFTNANGITCLTSEKIFEMGNITKTQSKATLNEPTPQGEGSGSGIGRQETMGGAIAQIRSEGALIQSIDPPLSTGYTVGSGEDIMEHDIELTDHVPQTSYDSPFSGGHTPRSDEGSMTLKELMNLYTTLLHKVLDLENVKTAQANEIASLKKRVTKLEQRQSLRISGFHPFRADINDVLNEDADIKMIVEDNGNGEKEGSTTEVVSTARPDISAARLKVSTAEPKTPPTTTTLFDDEDVTIVDTLEPEPVKKTKKNDQDQVERDIEAALAEMYDEVQAQIDADHELAVRLTYEEQEKTQLKKGSEEDEKRIGSRKKRAAGSSSKHKSHKKQKVNDQVSDDNDKEHRKCLKVVPYDDKAIDYETLDVKSLIVDFLGRQDVLDLHKIIIERFLANDLEGCDLILWGDLKTLVESSEDDEIWRNQQD
nr:hypothetical protein [Tanacetum cinerariifolium]